MPTLWVAQAVTMIDNNPNYRCAAALRSFLAHSSLPVTREGYRCSRMSAIGSYSAKSQRQDWGGMLTSVSSSVDLLLHVGCQGCRSSAARPLEQTFSDVSDVQLGERRALVRGDMVSLTALDLILWRVGGRAVRLPLVFEIAGMDPDDHAADVTSFRVPSDTVANFELFSHLHSPNGQFRPGVSK